MIKRLFSLFVIVAFVAVIGYNSVSRAKLYGAFAASANTAKNYPVVIIDAGHGGFDGGAVANDGTVEKDLNLEIVLKLEAVLRAVGYNTVTVRTTDTAVNNTDDKGSSAKVNDIKNRVALMKKYPKAVFVSIHMNKYGTTQPHGAQVFYGKISGSDALAKCIQESVASNVQTDNKRVIKPTTKDIYLLHNATVPAVIVECGFLSNPNDLSNLKDDEYQLKIATSIAFGIIKYNNDVKTGVSYG